MLFQGDFLFFGEYFINIVWDLDLNKKLIGRFVFLLVVYYLFKVKLYKIFRFVDEVGEFNVGK